MIFTKWRCKYYNLLELYFKLEKGKHQGNPISDDLFILAWEICSSWKKTNENIDGFKCLRQLISLLSLRTCESLLWICYGSVKVCYGSCYYNRSVFKLFGIKMKQFQMLNRWYWCTQRGSCGRSWSKVCWLNITYSEKIRDSNYLWQNKKQPSEQKKTLLSNFKYSENSYIMEDSNFNKYFELFIFHFRKVSLATL